MTDTAVPSQTTAKFDNTVRLVDQKFRFKQDKLGNTRPTVEIKDVPVPSVEGLEQILNQGRDAYVAIGQKRFSDGKTQTEESLKLAKVAGKGLELILEVMQDQVRGVAAGIIGDDLAASQDNFPFAKLSWEAIANMERADRRSVTIPDETWLSFAADYIAIMPAITNKTKEQVELATQVYAKKLTPIKSNKEAIQKLQGQLGLYMEHTKSGEDFAAILDLLIRRADNYMKVDETPILAENL